MNSTPITSSGGRRLDADLAADLAIACTAGAYVWGQRPTQRVVVEGKVTKRTGKWQRPEDCRVFHSRPS